MSIREIEPKEAAERLAEFSAIDVRGDHEFRGPLGRVPGARHLPLGALEARAAELPKGRPLLLVCRSGMRSGKACELLDDLGDLPVVNLVGGMIAWNRGELPVEREAPASLTELLELALAWLTLVGPLTPSAGRDVLSGQLARVGASFERPSAEAVERILDFIEESLREIEPPDLDLSLGWFRRSLAGL